MSIILALLAAIGGIGTLLWRLNHAADATRNIAGAANDLTSLMRRWGWQRKAGVDPMVLVEDPRIAAVTMMAAVAQADGAPTTAERTMIVRQAMEHFGCSSKVADDMLSYARFLLADTRDPANCFRKFQPLVRKSCTTKERADLISMLRATAGADGATPETERLAIDVLARDLA